MLGVYVLASLFIVPVIVDIVLKRYGFGVCPMLIKLLFICSPRKVNF